jgi:hypothetical protein
MTYLIVKAVLSGIIVMIVSEVGLRNPSISGLIASLPHFDFRFHLAVARYLRCGENRDAVRSNLLVHLSIHSDVSWPARDAPKRRRFLGGFIHLLCNYTRPLFGNDVGPAAHRLQRVVN